MRYNIPHTAMGYNGKLFWAILALLLGLWLFSAVLHAPAHVPAPPRPISVTPMNSTADLPQASITIGGATLQVEVAATDAARTQGLSGRASLPEGGGMLFVFAQDGTWGFWMKDMQFSLDIVWIGETGKVVSVSTNVSPGSYPQVFYPPLAVRYVLEVPAGFSAAHGIAPGTLVSIPPSVQAQAALQSQ